MSRLFRIFLAGLLVLLPLFITIAIVVWLGQFLFAYAGPNSWLGRAVISLGFGLTASIYAAYFLGLLIVLSSIFFLGYLVESGARPLLIGYLEQLLDRIPIVSQILEVAKRVVGVFSQDRTSDLKNMQPVWCFFGGDHGAAVFGLMPSSAPVSVNGVPYVGVMIPTAPVPIGGALVYVPQSWVRPAEAGVDTLMNVYISMGVVPPPDLAAAARAAEKEKSEN